MTGDAVTGAGLDEALQGIEVAYFLIHSMEPGGDLSAIATAGPPSTSPAAAAAPAWSGSSTSAGWCRRDAAPSPHLGSRLEVERILLDAAPAGVALRASIVIGAGSRSFRFLVRLVERLPVLALPGWHENRTQPIDGRDVIEFLARAATAPRPPGARWTSSGRRSSATAR